LAKDSLAADGPSAGLALLSFVTAHAKEGLRAADSKVASASKLAFTEGPAYAADGSVYFTDMVNSRIMRLPPGGKGGIFGKISEVFRFPSGNANGLVFDLEGRLVVCEGEAEIAGSPAPKKTGASQSLPSATKASG